MDCRSVIHSLSDYVDDLLTQSEAQHVESHLQRCQPCLAVKADLQEIRRAARELPLHAPPRALWARIRQEIEQGGLAQAAPPARRAPAQAQNWWQRLSEKRFTFTLPQLAGASAVAASLIIFSAVRSELPTQPVGPAIVQQASADLTANSPAVRAMQTRIEERLGRLNTRKASWKPEVKQTFEEHLKRIDYSLDSTREALRKDPKLDQQILLDLYKEKLQVLEDFDRLR
jgi:anti-sigma factor RsiW